MSTELKPIPQNGSFGLSHIQLTRTHLGVVNGVCLQLTQGTQYIQLTGDQADELARRLTSGTWRTEGRA